MSKSILLEPLRISATQLFNRYDNLVSVGMMVIIRRFNRDFARN